MKRIETVKKDKTKWISTKIKASTMAIVKENLPADRSISQEAFIDALVRRGLSHSS